MKTFNLKFLAFFFVIIPSFLKGESPAVDSFIQNLQSQKTRSIVVKSGLVKVMGVIALLLMFEFINLLIHPFISDLTYHSPLWMFIIMVFIAALLVPLHHRLEKWVTQQLVEKNKRIRLAAAKRTIQQLEG